jgi:hypothetical protein
MSDLADLRSDERKEIDAGWAEARRLRTLLISAVKIANEAAEEWDKAPSGMRAGKILLALAGHRKGYRPDTDAIHAALTPPLA